MGLKEGLIQIIYIVVWLFLLPIFILYWLGLFSFTTISQMLSLIPGLGGMVIRRVWYSHTLEKCGSNLQVDFLGAIRSPRTRVGNNCYIGVANWIGLAEIGDYFMSGSHVVILSGKSQHSFERMDIPMRLQDGSPERVKIGKDVWVGTGAVIMADVSEGTVVGAGSVVNKIFPEYSIIAGAPANIIKSRKEGKID